MFRYSSLTRCLRKLANGTVLEGTFSAKSAHLVSGVAILPDGRAYKGQFDETVGSPLPGTQLEEDGDLYRGSFNTAWQRHGQGEAWLADGTYYKGKFQEDDLVEGEVRVASGSSEVVYNGTLKDEMFVKGVLKQHDFTYVGEFEGNQPHGKGKLEFAAGGMQEGTFIHGKLHGANNKMVLEGGFTYVGEFLEGQICSGTLYTPTYTYEGEFNAQGKAHGEGTQIHLASSPKLTFTGVWMNGSMTRGTCTDEDGAPVDWQDNHDLQQQVLQTDDTAGSEALTVHRYCTTKANEAKQLHKDFNKSYLHDAKVVQGKTGSFPSKYDIGYEHSVRASHDAVTEQASLARPQPGAADSLRSLKKEIQFDRAVDDLPMGAKQVIDLSKAKMKVLDTIGAQQVSVDRMDEQLSRYLRDEEEGGTAGGDHSSGDGLHINANAPWKSFTPRA